MRQPPYPIYSLTGNRTAPKFGSMPSSKMAKMICRRLWQTILSSNSLICAGRFFERIKSPNTRLMALKVDSTLERWW